MSLAELFHKYKQLGDDYPHHKGVQDFVRTKKGEIYGRETTY